MKYFKYLKDNSYTPVKLFLNQFGMTVLGIMCYLVCQNNETLVLITSIFVIVIYLFLLHTVVWEEGGKHRIRVDGNRAEPCPLAGLILSVAANLPNIIIAILVYIGYFAAEGGVLHTIGKAAGYLLEGMYMGLIALYTPFNPIGFTLIIFPAIFVTTLSFYLGYKEVSIKKLFKLNPPAVDKADKKK